MRRSHPANIRAAWWTLIACRRVRRHLERDGLEAACALAPPPPLPAEAERGMFAVLRRNGATCLVSAIVRQTWEVAHGRRRDLVVGITSPNDFSAHAWLEGDPVPPPDDPGVTTPELRRMRAAAGLTPAPRSGGFQELFRRPASGAEEARV